MVPKHVDTKNHPNKRYCDIDRPFKFCIFFTGSESHGQRNQRADNDQLPSPVIDFTEQVAVHSRFAQALQRIVNPGKNSVTHKGKNYCVGMQWPYSSERKEADISRDLRKHKLKRHNKPHHHAGNSPKHGRIGKLFYDVVVVGKLF
jgi:hypothetical protein